MNKCKYCGGEGIIKKVSGCFYAQCSECNKHIKIQGDEYQFLGVTELTCKEIWNNGNPLNGSPRKSLRIGI